MSPTWVWSRQGSPMLVESLGSPEMAPKGRVDFMERHKPGWAPSCVSVTPLQRFLPTVRMSC